MDRLLRTQLSCGGAVEKHRLVCNPPVSKFEDSGDITHKPPPMVTPQRLVPRLCEVPLGELLDEGVRGLILDLDNTLVGYGRRDIDEHDRAWVAAAHAAGVRMVMLSNNTTGKVRWASSELGIPGIDWALKPLPHGFRRAVDLLGLPREQIRVIGDQFFTDILGARFAGVASILVEPIVSHDWPGTKLLRALERLVLPHRRSS